MLVRFAVVGHPIAHSKSPAMHAAAYVELHLPHTFEKIDVDEAHFPKILESLKHGDFDGINVTVPHKLRAFELADDVAPSAKAVHAANVLVRDDAGKITAHNTDVAALEQELRVLAEGRGGSPFVGRTGVVIGRGGAARAAIAAIGKLGCRRVVILARDADDVAFVREAERILHESAPNPDALGTTSILVRSLADGAPAGNIGVVVQATSCGMSGGPEGSIVANAVPFGDLAADAIAYDVVYVPRETPFLRAARVATIAAENGLGMLARQGAIAFELWLGIPAPLAAMRRAIE